MPKMHNIIIKKLLPPVDAFGDLVSLQRPPELAALGISSLHILGAVDASLVAPRFLVAALSFA